MSVFKGLLGSVFHAKCVITVLLLISPHFAFAQSITPSHVYQVAENVSAEVKLLLDANFSSTTLPKEKIVPGLRPRHVLQQALHIRRQIAKLKEINGIPVRKIAPIPVREIRPADVKQSVDQILIDVRSLRQPFGVTETVQRPKLHKGKKPSDVIAHLEVVAQLVQRLDIPAIVPNDVYRVALAIKADALQIHQTLKAPDPDPIRADIKGNLPPQVYAQGYTLLSKLKALSESNKQLAIPGGVVIPPRKQKGLKPADVLGILNNNLAELSSFKVTVGAHKPTKMIPQQVGQTPNDVYILVEETIAIINAIAKIS